jgi:hypothetical protein
MTKVFTGASMSLDGYIAGPGDTGFEHLFKWYDNGDVEVPTTHPELTTHLTAASAEYFRGIVDGTGSLVVGRRLFDSMDAWGGEHPMGVPVVVVSHSVPDGWPSCSAAGRPSSTSCSPPRSSSRGRCRSSRAPTSPTCAIACAVSQPGTSSAVRLGAVRSVCSTTQ